jgi:hypothetical protein
MRWVRGDFVGIAMLMRGSVLVYTKKCAHSSPGLRPRRPHRPLLALELAGHALRPPALPPRIADLGHGCGVRSQSWGAGFRSRVWLWGVYGYGGCIWLVGFGGSLEASVHSCSFLNFNNFLLGLRVGELMVLRQGPEDASDEQCAIWFKLKD